MKIPSGVRYFNKYILNKLTGKIAQAGWGPFAILYHVGRKSGKHYETPIWVFPTQGGFMIALTYGPNVDWYRNVSAAGKCDLLYHRREYALEKIEPVDRKSALPKFPLFVRTILGLVGMQDFIRMQARAA